MNRHARGGAGGGSTRRVRPALGIGFSICIGVTAIAGAPVAQAGAEVPEACTEDASAVVAWNAVASDAISIDAALVAPTMAIGMAYVQAAVYNAVEGLTEQHELYKWNKDGPHGASRDAAVAAAARGVLLAYFPAAEDRVEAAYTDALAEIPDGESKTDGIRYGARSARHTIHQRADDGWMGTRAWDREEAPGIWRPTPPGFAPFAGAWLSNVTPFLLRSSNQFRPGPPPSLTSEEYTADFLEVAELGSATSETRTEEQTTIANFFGGNLTTQLHQGYRDHVTRHCLGSSDAARYFAVATLNVGDAVIAGWDAKFHYGSWRPVSAIQLADTDGNPNTPADPEWMPLLITPPHSDYLSGHCISIGAATAALRRLDGTADVDLDLYSTVTGTTRHYDHARTLKREGIGARIWGGIHTRTADEVGTEVGVKIGRWTSSRYFGEL